MKMANNPIPIPKQEKIVNLSERGYAIRRIAKDTGTCRPTVRKYQEIGVQYPKNK
jgi:DNA-binding NarL/FixJ family response regulator